jgi:hypothetical protein
VRVLKRALCGDRQVPHVARKELVHVRLIDSVLIILLSKFWREFFFKNQFARITVDGDEAHFLVATE